jgi:hypothetical protein
MTNYWSECGRAASVASSGALGRPHRSVLALAGRAILRSDMFFLNCIRARWPAVRVDRVQLLGPCLSLLTALAVGCAHSEKNLERAGSFEVLPAPVPPLFLNGPMALLLTNADGFRARVVLESGAPAQAAPMVAGELLVRGGQLLFAPDPSGAPKKQARVQDSAFIWDVSGNHGYVLNDPLQGYAPVSSSRQYTNIAAGAALGNAAPERIAGHPCLGTEVTVTASDGATTFFQVWRARDLNALPLRITCPSNGLPVTLTLSKVRLETVPEDLFLPPNGFTKYDSVEALMTELALRGMNLGRKPIYPIEDTETTGGRETRMPTRP